MKAKIISIKSKGTYAMRQTARSEHATLENGIEIFRLTWPGDKNPESSAQSWRFLKPGSDIPREVKPKLRGALRVGQEIEIEQL